MVDSVNNSVGSSLLRAQQAQALNNIKSSNQATQQLINQLQKTAVPVKTINLPPVKLAGTSSADVLPRGSLVDKLV